MKKLVLILVASVSIALPAAGESEMARWEQQAAERHHHPGRLGHRTRLRQN